MPVQPTGKQNFGGYQVGQIALDAIDHGDGQINFKTIFLQLANMIYWLGRLE
jgi:hypothetical protein